MKFKPQLLIAIVSAGILLTGACGSDEAAPSQSSGQAATPDVQATLTAQAQTIGLGTPTPTPVPTVAKAVALEFDSAQRAVSADWDRFHADYDSWREGLTACTAGSFRSSLQGFAGRYAEITESARALPRPAVVRELGDTLVQAAEQEEEALRQLRDTWQPGETITLPAVPQDDPESDAEQTDNTPIPVTVSVFEQVDIARAAASARRQSVVDVLTDREKRTSNASVASISEFVSIFNNTDLAWDEFHLQYDTLRIEEGQLNSAETVNRLGLLINQFRDIVITIRQLPTTVTTRPVAEILAQAAEQEELALRTLRDTFQLNEGNASGAIGETVDPATSNEEMPAENGSSSESDTGDGAAGTFTRVDATLFDAFDVQLVDTNAARLGARHDLEDILEDISEETQIEVREFTAAYKQLLRNWDSFHTEYDQWRRDGGGCDQSEAAATLAGFTVAFSKISSAVRDLPTATVLRPLGEILIEAAEREERALREVRDTWRPNEAEVYQTLDQERSTAGRLRRQVTNGIQELLERYGISSQK